LQAWYSGFPEQRHKMQLAPGTLSVCTGHPGYGKTSLMANIWFNTARSRSRYRGRDVRDASGSGLSQTAAQFHAGCPQSQMTDEQMWWPMIFCTTIIVFYFTRKSALICNDI
jgi:hypothetical protein